MRKLIISVLMLMFATVAVGQHATREVFTLDSAPSGACTVKVPGSLYIYESPAGTLTFYSCQSSAWEAIGTIYGVAGLPSNVALLDATSNEFEGTITVDKPINAKAGFSGGKHRALPILAIGFDDGAESVQDVWPLMKARNIPLTIYINTGLTSGLWPTTYGTGDCEGSQCRMTTAELVALHNDGVEMQSHGSTHVNESTTAYDTVISDEWLPEFTYFETNFGYRPTIHTPPGAAWSESISHASAGYFEAIRNNTAGYISLGGMSDREGGRRFWGSAYFPPGDVEDGDEICEYLRNIFAYTDNTFLALGFHGFVTTAPDANVYLISEFTTILDCVEELRDEGMIEVLTYDEAIAARKRRSGPWQFARNPGWGHPAGTANAAHGWILDSVDTALSTDGEDSNLRKMVVTQSNVAPSQQRFVVDDLMVGETYIFGVEHESDTASDGTNNYKLRIRPADSMGQQATDWIPPAGVDTKQYSYLQFKARQPTAWIGFDVQSSATCCTVHTFRRPRLFLLESIGGAADTYSAKYSSPALVPFEITDATAAIGAAATVVTSIMVQRDPNGRTMVGQGPTEFLITRLSFTSSGTANFDYHFDGADDGGGTDFCGESVVGISPFTESETCRAVDEDSQDGAGTVLGTIGNELHLSITNNDGSANTVTYTIEGVILR